MKVPLSDEINDLNYEVIGKGYNLHDKNQPVIKFFTKRLKDANGVCSTNNFPLTLNRGVSSEVPIMGEGFGPDDTTANTYGYLYDHSELVAPDVRRVNLGMIRVGSYYYTDILYPGATCENYNDPVAEKARSAEPLGAIVKAIKAMH